jgi:hypothetical protein
MPACRGDGAFGTWQEVIRQGGYCLLCTGSKLNLDAPDFQGWLNRGELLVAPIEVVWRG